MTKQEKEEAKIITNGLKLIRKGLLAKNLQLIADGYEVITEEKIQIEPEKTKLELVREQMRQEGRMQKPEREMPEIISSDDDDEVIVPLETKVTLLDSSGEAIVRRGSKMQEIVSPVIEEEALQNAEIARKKPKQTRPAPVRNEKLPEGVGYDPNWQPGKRKVVVPE